MNTESYLVQILKKPFRGEPKTPIESIAKYGLGITGLPSEVSKILSEICVFGYMGSSEYEFGAIPKALRKMAESKELVAFSIPVDFYYKGWKDPEPLAGTRIVCVICNEQDKDEVVERIKKMAKGESRHKERPCVDESIAESEYAKDNYGWLELDNGYMFFKCTKMYKRFCALFGIEPSK